MTTSSCQDSCIPGAAGSRCVTALAHCYLRASSSSTDTPPPAQRFSTGWKDPPWKTEHKKRGDIVGFPPMVTPRQWLCPASHMPSTPTTLLLPIILNSLAPSEGLCPCKSSLPAITIVKSTLPFVLASRIRNARRDQDCSSPKRYFLGRAITFKTGSTFSRHNV